ncbi:MAG TPA: hypothetical protein VFN52_01250, partial [Acidiferrobacteraceae bacterium]|nr:hypothetical protein [Acidiferrobacteraceae bacterium]
DTQLARNGVLADVLRAELAPLAQHPNVRGLRQTGMVAALDLVQADGRAWPPQERRGRRACHRALGAGALLRPLGDTLYLMPPFAIQENEIRLLVNALVTGIDYAAGAAYS